MIKYAPSDKQDDVELKARGESRMQNTLVSSIRAKGLNFLVVALGLLRSLKDIYDVVKAICTINFEVE